MQMLRRFAAAAVVAFAVVGSFEPFFLDLLFSRASRARNESLMTRIPDRAATGYPDFLREVSRRTGRGAKVAVVFPGKRWHGGYSYGYFRAAYFLAGREVLPLVNRNDQFLTANFAQADYIASWQNSARVGGFDVVWSGHDGVLLRRAK